MEETTEEQKDSNNAEGEAAPGVLGKSAPIEAKIDLATLEDEAVVTSEITLVLHARGSRGVFISKRLLDLLVVGAVQAVQTKEEIAEGKHRAAFLDGLGIEELDVVRVKFQPLLTGKTLKRRVKEEASRRAGGGAKKGRR